MKKESGLKKYLTTFWVFLLNLVRPRAKNPWIVHSMVWMLVVFLVWFIFRLNPEQIVNQPILKYNHMRR